jgi:hypothetical protein
LARTQPAAVETRRAAFPLQLLAAIGPGVILALWWLARLAGRAGTAVPGAVAGDNLTFIWNVWWTRQALLHDLAPSSTALLFYPFGADLTLHTQALLPAIAVSGIANPVAALNVLIVAHLVLNFALMYALAFRETRSTLASLAGATIFGCSPFLGAHLGGHFNLIAAWLLPFAALLTLRAVETPTFSRGMALGLGLGATAYVDYYYFIYCGLLAAVLAISPSLRLSRAPRAGTDIALRGAVAFFLTVALVAIGAAAIVLITGGGVWHIGPRLVSMRSAWGPVSIAWLCSMLALVTSMLRGWRLSIEVRELASLRPACLGAAAVLAIAIGPLALRTIHLLQTGAYVTQAYRWRSAPAGVDLMTLLAGNPSSFIYGALVRPLYAWANVNLVEHVAWLGPGAIGLCIAGVSGQRRFKRWAAVLVVFGMWAIGPSLQFAGHATPLWMPAVLIRWIPVVANARIPARAMIVVYLACGMLGAFGAQTLLDRRRARWVLAALGALLIADYLPAPAEITQLDPVHTVDVIAASARPGAVLEVPFGLKDGFGETGSLDPRAMWFQTVHHRPMAGGFVARLRRTLAADYMRLPVLGILLRLSGGETLTEEEVGRNRLDGNRLASEGFRFVLVNRDRLTPALDRYVSRSVHLHLVADDETYDLYEIRAEE